MAKVKIKTNTQTNAGSFMTIDIISAEDIIIRPNRHELIKTDMRVDIPSGYTMLVFPKASLGVVGLLMCNSVMCIDSSYHGEVLINLYNTSYKSIAIKSGQRIASAMLVKPIQIDLVDGV